MNHAMAHTTCTSHRHSPVTKFCPTVFFLLSMYYPLKNGYILILPRKFLVRDRLFLLLAFYRIKQGQILDLGSKQRFSSFLAHLAFRPCELLSSLVVRPSTFHILIFPFRNHWANCNQTLVEWSLDGPLPKLCPVILTSNQDGRQAKNRKKGDEIFK